MAETEFRVTLAGQDTVAVITCLADAIHNDGAVWFRPALNECKRQLAEQGVNWPLFASMLNDKIDAAARQARAGQRAEGETAE